MVTAAGDTVDRVVGLESGADDYIMLGLAPAPHPASAVRVPTSPRKRGEANNRGAGG
jgi:hypothetical protein